MLTITGQNLLENGEHSDVNGLRLCMACHQDYGRFLQAPLLDDLATN